MKVTILGDGLISLTLAKTLVNEGIFVDIICNQDVKFINKTRTIGITKSNIDFFNKNILNISKLQWQIKKIEIFLEKFGKKKILDFDGNKEQLFSIIKNYKLYKQLNNSLKKNKFFKRKRILLNKFLKKNKEKIIINCDPKSLLTKKLFYKKIKKDYQSVSYISTIRHKKILQNNVAYQIFTKYGPIAFLPVSKYETSLVYSIKKKENLNNIDILDLIKKYNPKYSIVKIEKIQTIELMYSNLRTYYHDNILAFGDLLHKVHPLAGQGFNMTLRDIKQLQKIINDKLSLGLDVDSSIFVDFEKKIRHKNFLFTSGIDFIYEFFNFEKNIKSKNLGKAVNFIGRNKSLNNFFTKLADGGISV